MLWMPFQSLNWKENNIFQCNYTAITLWVYCTHICVHYYQQHIKQLGGFRQKTTKLVTVLEGGTVRAACLQPAMHTNTETALEQPAHRKCSKLHMRQRSRDARCWGVQQLHITLLGKQSPGCTHPPWIPKAGDAPFKINKGGILPTHFFSVGQGKRQIQPGYEEQLSGQPYLIRPRSDTFVLQTHLTLPS